MAQPASRVLSSSQLALLGEHGEERTAEVGRTCIKIGDESYPFIAILEGEVAVLDGVGRRDRATRPVRVPRRDQPADRTDGLPDGRVTKPMRYIAVEREELRRTAVRGRRPLRPAADRLRRASRGAAAARRASACRSSARATRRDTRRLLDFARSQRLPYTLVDPGPRATARPARPTRTGMPLVRLPGGAELHNPSNGDCSRALGIGARARAARRGRPADRRRRARRARRGRLRRLRGTRHAGDREHRPRRAGRNLATDRELPRLPGGHQRHRAHQPRRHAGAQVRCPHRHPLPRRSAGAGRRAPRGHARGRQRGRRAGGAARHGRRIPAPAGGGARPVRGSSACSTPPGRSRDSSAAASGWRSSAAATRPARRRSGSRAAARW